MQQRRQIIKRDGPLVTSAFYSRVPSVNTTPISTLSAVKNTHMHCYLNFQLAAKQKKFAVVITTHKFHFQKSHCLFLSPVLVLKQLYVWKLVFFISRFPQMKWHPPQHLPNRNYLHISHSFCIQLTSLLSSQGVHVELFPRFVFAVVSVKLTFGASKHIAPATVHSGRRACSLLPVSFSNH